MDHHLDVVSPNEVGKDDGNDLLYEEESEVT